MALLNSNGRNVRLEWGGESAKSLRGSCNYGRDPEQVGSQFLSRNICKESIQVIKQTSELSAKHPRLEPVSHFCQRS